MPDYRHRSKVAGSTVFAPGAALKEEDVASASELSRRVLDIVVVKEVTEV